MKNRFIFTLLFVFTGVCIFAQPVTITPPSANIQPGESVTLTASGATYYQWSPATGLSTTEGPVVVASPTVTTTYTCSGYAPGAESVVNGNFDQGNVGFTSAYQYNTNLFGEGTYYVDTDASLHHENFVGLGHGGTGNFMIVNGATSPGINVWTEQITVVPNTYYAFSTWVCTLAGTAEQVALLQFSINGTQIGNIFSAPPQLNTWQRFYELWYSGSSTSATITILNQNTGVAGNDFGLDDISFCEIVLVGAPQCTVYVGSMSATATADDTELCDGESTTLHALPVNGSGNYTYRWTPANTLDNPSAQHPVATPALGTTTYACQITDVGWNNTQEVDVTLNVYPTFDDIQIDTAICYEESYNFFGTVYTGSPQDPYTQQTIQASHTLQTIHGCDSIVNLDLTIYPLNETMPDPRNICTGDTLTWYDGNKYYQDGDVAYFDSTDFHGCRQVYRLELTVGDYQTPPNYDPNIYVCVPYDENPHFHWDVANRDYDEDAIDEVVVEGPPGECDYLYTLNLRFHKEFYIEEAPVVTCDQYKWPVTGEIFTHETAGPHIVRTFPYYFGDKICDSTYVLDITINESSTEETYTYNGNLDNVPCDSIPFIWFGDTLYFKENTIESNPIELEGLTPDSCEYKVEINIQNMKYTPQPVIDCPDLNVPNPHWPITATEFNVNRYTYQVTDIGKSDMSEWDIDQCEWKISKNSWRIIPNPSGNNPFECMIYAMDWVPDSICLSFKAVNSCTGSDGVIAEYWLHPSFYGIDEDGPSTSSGAFDFSIVPNPNSGQMKLVFDRFEGKVEVKVYDVMGNLVDEFETFNDTETKAMEYKLNGSKGIYFFVVNGKEGSMAKKVVIR